MGKGWWVLLTLKRVGGGRNQDIACSIASHFVCDKVKNFKPSCIFHFGCLKSFEKKIWGVVKIFFWKICVRNFFILWKSKKKILKIQFFQKNSYKIVLFHNRFEFRMILAFIWCAYCPYRWKIVFFWKSTCQKILLTNKVIFASRYGEFMVHSILLKVSIGLQRYQVSF